MTALKAERVKRTLLRTQIGSNSTWRPSDLYRKKEKVVPQTFLEQAAGCFCVEGTRSETMGDKIFMLSLFLQACFGNVCHE